MAIITIGIDLAQNVFSVRGVGESDKPELVFSEVPRAKLLALVANFPLSLISMEACSGAPRRSRELSRFGHTVPRRHARSQSAAVGSADAAAAACNFFQAWKPPATESALG